MVTLGIISDIHGKNEFLRVMLPKLEGCDKIINLGDIVGYDGDINEIVGQLNKPKIINLLGNHDLEALIDEKKADIPDIKIIRDGKELPIDYGATSETKRIIRSFPIRKTVRYNGRRYAFTHGYAADNNPHLFQEITEDNIREFLTQTNADYNFVGSSHVSKLITLTGEGVYHEIPIDSNRTIKLGYDRRYIINVGSLGVMRGTETLLNHILLDLTGNNVSFLYEKFCEALKQKVKQKEFSHLFYPKLEKNSWHMTELRRTGSTDENSIDGHVFSKLYNGFLTDVMVLRERDPHSFKVTGKILDTETNQRYNNLRRFSGPEADKKAMGYAVTVECQHIESLIESWNLIEMTSSSHEDNNPQPPN